MGEFTMQDVAMAIAESLAKRWFAGDADLETKVADAKSVAWEFCQTATDKATPGSVAYNAVRHVRAGRQFHGESVFSVDCPPKPWMRASRGQFRRVYVDLAEFAGVGDDPAEIVAVRIDAGDWLARLPEETRKRALALAAGHRTQDAARMFGVGESRIAQLRRELKESWEAFTA